MAWSYRITTEPTLLGGSTMSRHGILVAVFLDGLGLYRPPAFRKDDAWIRTAMVGLGKMGLSHLAIVIAHPDIDLVTRCDATAYLTDILDKHAGLKCYGNFEPPCSRASSSTRFVATPSKLHAPMVARHSTTGLHVFCESLHARRRRTATNWVARRRR